MNNFWLFITRRRNFLIKKNLQSRFVIGFSLAVFLGLSLNLLVTYFLIDRELSQELYKIHLKVRTTSEIAVPVIIKLGAVTIPAILIISALVGYYLTRRIETPLQAFGKAVKRLGQGDFSQRLPSDMPSALPEVFNNMAEALGVRFASLRGAATSLDRGFAGLKAAIENQTLSRTQIQDALRELSEARRSLRQELSKFKV